VAQTERELVLIVPPLPAGRHSLQVTQGGGAAFSPLELDIAAPLVVEAPEVKLEAFLAQSASEVEVLRASADTQLVAELADVYLKRLQVDLSRASPETRAQVAQLLATNGLLDDDFASSHVAPYSSLRFDWYATTRRILTRSAKVMVSIGIIAATVVGGAVVCAELPPLCLAAGAVTVRYATREFPALQRDYKALYNEFFQAEDGTGSTTEDQGHSLPLEGLTDATREVRAAAVGQPPVFLHAISRDVSLSLPLKNLSAADLTSTSPALEPLVAEYQEMRHKLAGVNAYLSDPLPMPIDLEAVPERVRLMPVDAASVSVESATSVAHIRMTGSGTALGLQFKSERCQQAPDTAFEFTVIHQPGADMRPAKVRIRAVLRCNDPCEMAGWWALGPCSVSSYPTHLRSFPIQDWSRDRYWVSPSDPNVTAWFDLATCTYTERGPSLFCSEEAPTLTNKVFTAQPRQYSTSTSCYIDEDTCTPCPVSCAVNWQPR
jgi:hypothetical protein